MALTSSLINQSLILSTLLFFIAQNVSTPRVTALETGSSCEESSVKNVVTSCKAYVVGSNPQPMSNSDNACCSSLHVTPLSCLCSHAASSMAYISSLLNQQAVRKVMETCGLDIPTSSKCIGINIHPSIKQLKWICLMLLRIYFEGFSVVYMG